MDLPLVFFYENDMMIFCGDLFVVHPHPHPSTILVWEAIHGRSTKKKVISQSVDDRTEAERGISCGSADSRMAGQGLRRQDVTSCFMMGWIGFFVVFGAAFLKLEVKEKATCCDVL